MSHNINKADIIYFSLKQSSPFYTEEIKDQRLSGRVYKKRVIPDDEKPTFLYDIELDIKSTEILGRNRRELTVSSEDMNFLYTLDIETILKDLDHLESKL